MNHHTILFYLFFIYHENFVSIPLLSKILLELLLFCIIATKSSSQRRLSCENYENWTANRTANLTNFAWDFAKHSQRRPTIGDWPFGGCIPSFFIPSRTSSRSVSETLIVSDTNSWPGESANALLLLIVVAPVLVVWPVVIWTVCKTTLTAKLDG